MERPTIECSLLFEEEVKELVREYFLGIVPGGSQ